MPNVRFHASWWEATSHGVGNERDFGILEYRKPNQMDDL